MDFRNQKETIHAYLLIIITIFENLLLYLQEVKTTSQQTWI